MNRIVILTPSLLVILSVAKNLVCRRMVEMFGFAQHDTPGGVSK